MPASNHPKLRVAAVQAAPVFLDLDATIDKTIALMAEAAAQGVKLIVFPETWVPGYPWWIWLDSPAWGMQFVQRYHDNALVLGSAEFERLQAACRQHDLWLSLGFSEKAGGSLYIAQALIDDQGNLLQTRRKLKPTHVERTVFGEGDGADLQVVQTAVGRIGSLCCWEHLQPLTRYALYAQNEQIHCAAWPSFSLYRGAAYALGHEVNNAASQMYAVEGGCFVIAPCATVSPAMSALLCTDAGKQQMLGIGGGYARIFAPDGSPLGTPLAPDEEGLLIADIDLGMIALAKAAADPAGHYSRPDVTRLVLDKTRRQPLVVHGASAREPATVAADAAPAEEPGVQD